MDFKERIQRAKSEQDASGILADYRDDLYGLCNETGKRPEPGSTHNCVPCRAFRTDQVENQLVATQKQLEARVEVGNYLTQALDDKQAELDVMRNAFMSATDRFKVADADLSDAREVAKKTFQALEKARGEAFALQATLGDRDNQIAALSAANDVLDDFRRKVQAFMESL